MQLVTVEVTGVESPVIGGETCVVVACANATSCALEWIAAAATRIEIARPRIISSRAQRLVINRNEVNFVSWS
jgi:hypothetical protein